MMEPHTRDKHPDKIEVFICMCMSLLGNSHHIWLPPLRFASKKEGVLPGFFPEQSEHGCSWRGALSSWYLTDFIPPWLCSPHPDGVQPPFFTYLVWPQIFNHGFWSQSNHTGSRGEDEQLRKEKVVVTPTCGDLSAEMSASSNTSWLSLSLLHVYPGQQAGVRGLEHLK